MKGRGGHNGPGNSTDSPASKIKKGLPQLQKQAPFLRLPAHGMPFDRLRAIRMARAEVKDKMSYRITGDNYDPVPDDVPEITREGQAINDIRRELMQVFESGIEGDNIAKIEAIIERAVAAAEESGYIEGFHDATHTTTPKNTAQRKGALARTIERAVQAEREDAQAYHHVMSLLRNTKMEHGLCQPRERRACTHCNAIEELDKLLKDYKGARIVASARSQDPPSRLAGSPEGRKV